MAVAYDVTVVSPFVEPSLSSSERSVGFVADAAKPSTTRTTALVRGYIFPLAQETLGRRSVSAGMILGLLADHIADRKGLQRATCRSAIFRELGIATQRSIARDIIERSVRIPEDVSAQLSTYLRRG
jgi:hypothetical protein